MQEKVWKWCLSHPSSGSRDKAVHLQLLFHPSPSPSSLASSTPCVSFVITLWPDLFILSITALLFSPPSLLLQNIFHLITGRSAGVVESLVCWGVRCTMGSQTCNPPESLFTSDRQNKTLLTLRKHFCSRETSNFCYIIDESLIELQSNSDTF